MQLTFGNWGLPKRKRFTAQELAVKYDNLSPTWDKTIQRMGFDRAYTNLFTDLAADGQLTHLGGGAKIFDAGVGTGSLSYALAQAHTANMNFHGIDISDNMIEQAHANMSQLGIDAQLRTGDARYLPYEDNSFDCVITAHMLEHLDNPLIGLKELVRILKPQGTLLLVMTRKSVIGKYIDLQWRLNRVDEDTLQCWFSYLGLQHVTQHYFAAPFWANWASMVFTAQKVD